MIPPGPATIEIGTVTTGLPGTNVNFPQAGPNSGSISRTGTSYIYGLFLLETTLINSILTVRNPIGNPN